MDNDRAGKAFTINLLGRLSKPENDLSNNIKAEINVSQKTEATLSINFSYDTDEKRRAMANNLKEYLIDPLKNNVAEGSEAIVKVLTITKSTHNAQIEIKFPYDNANLLTVEKGLIQLKGWCCPRSGRETRRCTKKGGNVRHTYEVQVKCILNAQSDVSRSKRRPGVTQIGFAPVRHVTVGVLHDNTVASV